MNNHIDTRADARLLALRHANRVRKFRAELKRRLRSRETTVANVIMSSSRDIDTMTVHELLLSQPGWGPTRSSTTLGALSLSESKTLGALTERQRLMLATAVTRDP